MADKKKFSLPEDITKLTNEELDELRVAARDEITEINGTEGDLAVEQLEALEALLDATDKIDAQRQANDAAQKEVDDRLAAARERASKLDKPAEDEKPAEGDKPTDKPAEGDKPAEDAAPVEPAADAVADAPADVAAPEPVLAAGVAKPTVAFAKKNAPAVIIPKDKPVDKLTKATASTDVPNFSAGQELADMSQVTQAFLERVSSFGGSNPKDMRTGVYDMSPRATKFGVAKIERAEREFSVSKEQSLEEQMATIMAAASMPTGGLESLIASGWCAPSETIYELFSYHTNAGLVDVPEVTARRGGIQFTKGVDFMEIYGDPNAGFTMTETQAEAGTFTKPCYALECPPFQEVRLDAVGFCATAPLLTEAAYPELVRQVLDMLGTGHARRKSASTIARIRQLITATVEWAADGSMTADVLAGFELQALRLRQSLAMDPGAVLEGIAPYWFRNALRNDLSRRLGVDNPFRISDADIDGYLALRGIRLQYVYDYQMLTSGTPDTVGGTDGWKAWPTKVEVMLYPAGAFTRLVNDVINLSAVYDHDLLTGNEYTAAFVEEGMAVANTRGYGIAITFTGLNYFGASGFPSVGAGEGITIPAAA
jgi:hypothetical protein